MPTVQLITPQEILCHESNITQSGVHTITTGRSVTGDNKRKLNSTLNVSFLPEPEVNRRTYAGFQ